MEDMFDLMETLFGGIWDLCSRVTVPGFGISLAKVLIGFFVIKWSLNLLGLVTGFRSNVGSASEQMRTNRETMGQYRKVREQQEGRSKLSGGMGFRP